MLERNLLAHIRLGMLLTTLTASILMQAKLVPQSEQEEAKAKYSPIPFASVEFACAILCAIAGVTEYQSGYQDFLTSRPFLSTAK